MTSTGEKNNLIACIHQNMRWLLSLQYREKKSEKEQNVEENILGVDLTLLQPYGLYTGCFCFVLIWLIYYRNVARVFSFLLAHIIWHWKTSFIYIINIQDGRHSPRKAYSGGLYSWNFNLNRMILRFTSGQFCRNLEMRIKA